MTPCIHCGSTGPDCDWVSPLDVIDADPPCRAPDYDRAIALLWQGPISDARLPRPDDPDEVYGIVIGAKGDKLYVNGRQVSPVTPEGLKPALVWAAKTPIHQADKGKK